MFVGWFWELSTERAMGFGSMGPIPMSAVRRFCRELGLDHDLIVTTKIVIGTIDNAYLEWVRDNAPKAQTSGPPPPPTTDAGWPKKRRR